VFLESYSYYVFIYMIKLLFFLKLNVYTI
jgi:hypothetical protein